MGSLTTEVKAAFRLLLGLYGWIEIDCLVGNNENLVRKRVKQG